MEKIFCLLLWKLSSLTLKVNILLILKERIFKSTNEMYKQQTIFMSIINHFLLLLYTVVQQYYSVHN